MTSTQQQWSSSPTSRRPVDELQWVIQIRESIEQETGEPINVSVSVFSVPNSLVLSKPEAYIPQLFAVGPYHHWDPHLYEMERYKLATARRTQRKLHGINLRQLVDYFTINEFMIRAYYHRFVYFHLVHMYIYILFFINMVSKLLFSACRIYVDILNLGEKH